jgi:choline dehydrogenase-like flavoprotein
LGIPRVEVDWRLDKQVRRTADRSLALIATELRHSGIAQVTLDPSMELHGWPATMEAEGTWHHMGTTRMHSDEKKGVVDADCKVHGFSNFYIAGSSVFPTAGANFPTITVTALALRLAEHVIAKLKNVSSALVEEVDLVQNVSVVVENTAVAAINVNGLSAV